MALPNRQFSLHSAAPRWWILLALLVAFSIYVYGARRDPTPSQGLRFGGATMGTSYSVLLGKPLARPALQALQSRVDGLLAEINASMSTFDPNSEISRFNDHRSTEPLPVSPALAQVVAMGLEVGRASQGSFDISVGPLVDAWGFGPAPRPSAPLDAARVSALKARVGQSQLHLERGALRKEHPELRIDLSAIAKGYAVDRVALLLEQQGIDRYLVEIGGELRGRGHNAEGHPFRVGIEDPDPERRRVRWAVRLDDGALATSGNYRNHIEIDGQRYAHTLDPKTGRPARHRLLSVSVWHPSCAMADAWATALMAAGPEQAWDLVQAHGLEALLLVKGEDADIVERATEAFVARRLDK